MHGGNRSTVLRKIYRNSARVWGFAAFLLRDIAKFYDENPQLQFSPKRGVDPKLISCKSPSQQINACIQEIKEIGKNNYSWRNVLLLYHHARTKTGYPLIETLIRRLEEANIPKQWITENMDAKNTFNWSEDSVKISTALSAKGLDAPKVIVLSAESFRKDSSDHDDMKLMYVALTRAREELTIFHTGNEGIVPELYRCQEFYNKNRDTLIQLEKEAVERAI